MKLLLIRHGDPDYANDTLTPRGHVQARLLAEHLLSVPINRIYVSPRGRAQATARYTLERRGQQGTTLDWLAELRATYAPGLVAWDLHPVDLLEPGELPERETWAALVPYGDLLTALLAPFYAAWDALMAEHGYARVGLRYAVRRSSEETLAFFCHAGVTLSVLAHLLHIPPPLVYAHFGCDTSSVTALETDEKGGWATFRLNALNDMSHAPNMRLSPRQHTHHYGF